MIACFKEHGICIVIVSISLIIIITIILNAISFLNSEKANPRVSSLILLCNKKFMKDKEYICCNESIRFLPNNCFSDGKSLKRIDFMGDILSIETDAFSGCDNVEEINFYGKVCHYSAEAFSKLIKLKRIYFKELYVIYEKTFSNLENLKSITVKQGLQDIENDAFLGCGKLKSFKTENICLYCSNETKTAVVIPCCMHCLPSWTFAFCSNVETIIIPHNVIFIEPHCFLACEKLTEIQYADNLDKFKKIFPSFAVELPSTCVIKTSDNSTGKTIADIIGGK